MFLNNIKWVILVIKKQCVFCRVASEFLHVFKTNFTLYRSYARKARNDYFQVRGVREVWEMYGPLLVDLGHVPTQRAAELL
jgi:hypothetical protein